jgi:hypothetical protein
MVMNQKKAPRRKEIQGHRKSSAKHPDLMAYAASLLVALGANQAASPADKKCIAGTENPEPDRLDFKWKLAVGAIIQQA